MQALAEANAALGNHDSAIARCTEATSIYTDLDDRYAFFLRIRRQLDLMLLYWFERVSISDSYQDRQPYLESGGHGRMTADLAIHENQRTRSSRNLD